MKTSFAHLHLHTEYSMLDGAAGRGRDRDRGGGRATRGGDHRPREHVRRPRVLQGGARDRHQADHRHGGLLRRHQPLRSSPPRRPRHLPPHAPRRKRRRLPQPDQDLVAGVPRRVLLQAPGRLRAARAVRRGPHRDERLPRQRDLSTTPRRRPRRRSGARRPLPRHRGARSVLHRAPRPRARRPTASQPRLVAHRP